MFSEYQTGTIDLAVDFYGYEDCPKNYSFGPAVREQFVLHYISKGKGSFHYDNQIYHLKKGDLFLLKPNESTFYQADAKQPWSYYWIGISGTKAEDYFRLSQLYDTGIIQNLDTRTIGKLIIQSISQTHGLKSDNHLHLLGQLYELLHLLALLNPTTKLKQESPTQELYHRSKRIIETHYTIADLSIQGIADELNVNRSYLTTVFKHFNSSSPKEFLHHVRMERAKQLLETTSVPVKTVALSVGFSDPLYFSKAFKQFFQLTPTQVRDRA